MSTIKVSIVGAFGYTGLEMIRLLSLHPKVEIKYLFSKDSDIDPLKNYPHLCNFHCGEICNNLDEIAEQSDLVFLSLPHGKTKDYIDSLIGKVKIVDLSADFRIQDKELYEKYYNDYPNKEILRKFIYGFIENNKNEISIANYVANPGCFALCMQLTILPFIKYAKRISIFALTGSSGGGKQPSEKNHHSIRSKDVWSYNIGSHRHNAEVYQTFKKLNDHNFIFVPSSGPFVRGIFLNAFVELSDNNVDYDNILNNTYENDVFCRVKKDVHLNDVVGSNFFDISCTKQSENVLVIQSAIDNIIKGASGNAIQCMNLMFGLSQTEGLGGILPIYI